MAERLTKEAIEARKETLIANVRTVGGVLDRYNDPQLAAAWADIQAFLALGLRVMAKTNLSKLRSEMVSVELAQRANGRPVLD